MARKLDLTGQKFERLTVIREATIDEKPKDKNGNPKVRSYWLCQCDCGNFIQTTTQKLNSNNTKSCGCLKGNKLQDITGLRFGKWTVLEKESKHEDGFYYWKCRCDCGTEKIVRGNNLRNGISTSCGCEKSKGETFVKNLLENNNISFKREYHFNDLKGKKSCLRFDFAINPQENLKLIEVMGTQHWKTSSSFYSEQIKEYDLLKKDYCKNNNIPILYLWYNEDDTFDKKLWEENIKLFLGGDYY